ncbi:unnamed protein product, partial [Prorocentrum cordatum]
AEAAEQKLQVLKEEMEAKVAAAAQDNDATRALEVQLSELRAEKEQFEQKLNEEKLRHNDAKVRIEKAESEARDLSNRSNEQRRMIKELEEAMQEQQVLSARGEEDEA